MNLTLPQQVTIRYAANLLRKGTNDTFDIIQVVRQSATHDGITIGYYYTVSIKRHSSDIQQAAGVTPLQSVQRALEKAGVTFR